MNDIDILILGSPADLYPDIMNQWDFNKNNKNDSPYKITRGSRIKIWWLCSKNHSYQQTLSKRFNGNHCPQCKEKNGIK